jgi:hypothetical protein
MKHSPGIDFFAWPGLRERFMYFQHNYCSNLFWYLFRKSFRFAWPFDARDCYTINNETGLYEISMMFDQRVADIQCWTMGPEIFEHFPEFQSDMPMYNRIPRSVGPKLPQLVSSDSGYYSLASQLQESQEAAEETAGNPCDSFDHNFFDIGDMGVDLNGHPFQHD